MKLNKFSSGCSRSNRSANLIKKNKHLWQNLHQSCSHCLIHLISWRLFICLPRSFSVSFISCETCWNGVLSNNVICCQQTMTDVVGNPEEERRAEFYYQPWAQEAVCRYFYSKVSFFTFYYTFIEWIVTRSSWTFMVHSR